MSHVKISTPGGLTSGATIEIDGHPVQDVSRIQVDMPVDDIAQVHLGVNVTQPFEWEGDASVNLHLHVPEGCRLIDIRTHSDPPGTAKWIVTKITPVILFLLLSAPAFAQGVMKYTKAAPSTPEQAVEVFKKSHPPIEFPVVYDGPTVTFTGAVAPTLGPWDRWSSHVSYYETTGRVHSRYARGSYLSLRTWQPQDRRGRVHVLSSARFSSPSLTRHLAQRSYVSRGTRNLSRVERRVPQHLLRSAPGRGAGRGVPDVAGQRSQRRSHDPGRRQNPPAPHQR